MVIFLWSVPLSLFCSNNEDYPVALMLSFYHNIVLPDHGVLIEKICYKPLRNQPRINALITGQGLILLKQRQVLPSLKLLTRLSHFTGGEL